MKRSAGKQEQLRKPTKVMIRPKTFVQQTYVTGKRTGIKPAKIAAISDDGMTMNPDSARAVL